MGFSTTVDFWYFSACLIYGHYACLFRISAPPKRWIGVTAPVCATVLVEAVLQVRCVAIVGQTVPGNLPLVAGWRYSWCCTLARK